MKFAGCSTTLCQTQLETRYNREMAKCIRYDGHMLYQDRGKDLIRYVGFVLFSSGCVTGE